MADLPLWMGTVPDYTVDNDEIVHIRLGDLAIAVPAPIFLAGCAKGIAAIEAKRKAPGPTAEVIQFPGRQEAG